MLWLSLGTPYVVNPSDMVDAMGHEQWAEWQAFNELYPIGHTSKMLGSIALMLGGMSGKVSAGELLPELMPWAVQPTPETATERDAATSAALATMPMATVAGVKKQTSGTFVL